MVVLGSTVFEIERCFTEEKQIDFSMHLQSHLRVIFMRRFIFSWFAGGGRDENYKITRMMVEEGLNFVMAKVHAYTLEVMAGTIEAKEQLEVLCDHVSDADDPLVYSIESESFFEKYVSYLCIFYLKLKRSPTIS